MSENIYDYFQRACFRPLEGPRGEPGLTIYDRDGNSAVFWIETARSRVASVQYKCTTCVTLLALCEHLCEILVGKALSEVHEYRVEDLLLLHPEIPAERRDRAQLAIEALHSAVKKHSTGANH